jgi:hypothetical protein
LGQKWPLAHWHLRLRVRRWHGHLSLCLRHRLLWPA